MQILQPRLCCIFKVSVRELCVQCTFETEAIDSRVLVHKYPQTTPRLCLSVGALVAAKLTLNENLMIDTWFMDRSLSLLPTFPSN